MRLKNQPSDPDALVDGTRPMAFMAGPRLTAPDSPGGLGVAGMIEPVRPALDEELTDDHDTLYRTALCKLLERRAPDSVSRLVPTAVLQAAGPLDDLGWGAGDGDEAACGTFEQDPRFWHLPLGLEILLLLLLRSSRPLPLFGAHPQPRSADQDQQSLGSDQCMVMAASSLSVVVMKTSRRLARYAAWAFGVGSVAKALAVELPDLRRLELKRLHDVGIPVPLGLMGAISSGSAIA